MTRRLMSLAMLGLLAAVAACGSQPEVKAPLHAVPADSVFVSGTARCTFTPEGEGYLVECTLDMSDPRVSGSERQAGFRAVLESEQPPGTVWVTDTASLTNSEGSWHGSAQATELSDSGTLLEAHYVGEGAYQGLEFHYYLADVSASGDSAPIVMHGWISGGG